MSRELISHLLREAANHGYPLTPLMQTQLRDYLVLLIQWNKIHNLTAIRDPKEMVRRHILESVWLIPSVAGAFTLDVGTGAGLPGIPLAICLPEQNFVLIDSSAKKMHFVQHVVLSLKLKNVEVLAHRVENYQPEKGFDRIVSRAFASLKDFVQLTQHLCTPTGYWLAMKAHLLESEKAVLPEPFVIDKIETMEGFGIAPNRQLIWIHRP